MIQQNPSLLHAFIEQIKTSNPRLLQVSKDHFESSATPVAMQTMELVTMVTGYFTLADKEVCFRYYSSYGICAPQVIQSNQERFVEMLNEGPGESGGGGGAPPAPSRGGAGGSSDGRYVQVTPQEKEAIERVRRLGIMGDFWKRQSLRRSHDNRNQKWSLGPLCSSVDISL